MQTFKHPFGEGHLICDIALGRIDSKEILFVGLKDETLRAFSIGENGLTQLACLGIHFVPKRLLWLQGHELLLNIRSNETIKKNTPSQIEAYEFSTTANCIRSRGVALSFSRGINISGICLINSRAFRIFDASKNKLLECSVLV